MIISASRRTDIPAFYSEWFINRIREGFVYVRNPMNYDQISKIKLDSNVVDCIVFWTKDPKNIIKYLDELDKRGYKYYFQITINPYDNFVEKSLRDKEKIIDDFIKLSEKIGKHKVIWRYDPILLSNKYNEEFHYKNFEYLCNRVGLYTNKCIFSFIDLYQKTKRNIRELNIIQLNNENMLRIAKTLSEIREHYRFDLYTCSEEIDLDVYGIKHGKCIDDELISEIVGEKLEIDKDKNQRLSCGCVSSIDIGAYNTCLHNCIYCYANLNQNTIKNNIKKHNNKSPLIIGELNESEKIYTRKMESYRRKQLKLL